MFSSTFCMTVPETARAAPAMMQAKVLGSLTYHSILEALDVPGPDMRACQSSPGDRPDAPRQMLSTADSTRAAADAAISRAALFFIEELFEFGICFTPAVIRFEMIELLVHIEQPALFYGGEA